MGLVNHRGRVAVSSIALLLTLTAGVTEIGSAQAAVKNYPYNYCPDYPGAYISCIGWTGGYPGGVVGAWGGANLYSIQLQYASQRGGPYVTRAIAYNYPRSTASVPVAKYGWYKACFQTVKGGIWNCWANYYSYPMGD